MNELSVDAGEALVISILKEKGKKLTTWELDREVRGRDSRCPDEIVRFLAKMKQKGLIKGEISQERRGWVWWAE